MCWSLPAKFLLVYIIINPSMPLASQNSLVSPDEVSSVMQGEVTGKNKYLFDLDMTMLSGRFSNTPMETDPESIPSLISLPDENGIIVDFNVWESPVISSEMARKYPDFKTYTLSGVKDKTIHGRIFISRFGLEGMIIRDGKMIKLEPQDKRNAVKHISYTIGPINNLRCESGEESEPVRKLGKRFAPSAFTNGGTRRTYEIALVATGEFYQNANLGNNSNSTANAAIVSIINLINVRYNIEMAIHFTIFSSPTIYTNPSTDPFDPAGSDLTNQASTAVQASFPTLSYDLGHALNGMTSGGSGVAVIGGVCGSSKARGWSGGSNINTIAIGIMIHELGHMFGAHHTFNGNGANCAVGNMSPNSAVEIGSGTTIMSYAGSCQASNNVQDFDDDYFHSFSIQSFLSYISGTGGGCATNTATGNAPPTVIANPCSSSYTIPKLTPFSIQGSGSDPNAGNVLTYIWEQIDEDGAGSPTHGFIGNVAGSSAIAPLFRSYPPTVGGNKRIFPVLSTILNNSNVSSFEPLPNVARTINLRLTGRDNNTNNGGIGSDDIAISVSATAGPLSVTSPNTAVSWSAGTQTVTWAVNNTNSLFANVDILLSLDGGYSFPISLVTNTPNDGSQSFTLGSYPNTTQARVKIGYAPNSCFEVFDISDVNFTLSSSCSVSFSNICQTSSLSAPYAASTLNMGLVAFNGNSFSTKTLTTSGSTVNVAYNLTPASTGAGNCTTANFGYSSVSFSFRITTAGNYTFSMNTANPLTVYSGIYSSASPCSNYLGSTCYDVDGIPFGSASFSSQMTLNLSNPCGEYSAVLFRTAGTSVNLTITGPSGAIVYESNPNSGSGISYTYLAVNSSSNQIASVSSISDFTTLAAGSYCIYGVNFSSTLDPNLWIGQTLSAVQSSGNCLLFSSNCKPVTITCPSIVTASGDSGSGTIRSTFQCLTEGSIVTYNAGVNSVLTSPWLIDKNITLQGNGSTIIDLNFSGTYGIRVVPGKSLTLKDIKIHLSGTANPVIRNEGVLILQNTEVKGNVNPVIFNQGTINVIGSLPSTIKKL